MPKPRGFRDKFGDDLTVDVTYSGLVHLEPLDKGGDYVDLMFTPKKARKVAKAIKKAAKRSEARYGG